MVIIIADNVDLEFISLLLFIIIIIYICHCSAFSVFNVCN